MRTVDYLSICDAGLMDKPVLASIYDEAWREQFRRNILALPDNALLGWPMGYYLPILHSIHPAFYPADTQLRIEAGLAVLRKQVNETEWGELASRLRGSDSLVACDELLAAAAFAGEFGESAIKWPDAAKGQRRPEFFVESCNARWAVECKALQDNERVRELNATMLETGEGWGATFGTRHDSSRLQRELVRKIKRAQGGNANATVIIVVSQTPFLTPDMMAEEVQNVLCSPSEVDLDVTQLPIAVACLTFTVVQGVWLCKSACDRHGIDEAVRDRIRVAITRGFVLRGDGVVLPDAEWPCGELL
jgi:hypothetical protein